MPSWALRLGGGTLESTEGNLCGLRCGGKGAKLCGGQTVPSGGGYMVLRAGGEEGGPRLR